MVENHGQQLEQTERGGLGCRCESAGQGVATVDWVTQG